MQQCRGLLKYKSVLDDFCYMKYTLSVCRPSQMNIILYDRVFLRLISLLFQGFLADGFQTHLAQWRGKLLLETTQTFKRLHLLT